MALALAVVALGYNFASSPKTGNNPAVKSETTFERVMRTGTLRCAYYVFPPVTRRDPNTGALSGFSVDMMERIAQSATLKIEWAEEIDFGNWQPGLKSKRFDAICTPMWPEPALAREALFTRPMFYSGIHAYARNDDRRFDNNLAAINDPGMTIACQEGNATLPVAQSIFPKAKILSLPQNAAASAPAEHVMAHKADVLLWDENGLAEFSKNNPNSLHNVDPTHPLKVMPFELMVGLDDATLRDFLDVSLQSLEDTGFTGQMLDKWEVAKGSYFRMAKPYVVEGK